MAFVSGMVVGLFVGAFVGLVTMCLMTSAASPSKSFKKSWSLCGGLRGQSSDPKRA